MYSQYDIAQDYTPKKYHVPNLQTDNRDPL